MTLPKRSVLAWSVCYVLRTASKNPKSTPNSNNKAPTVKHLHQLSAQRERAESRIVVYTEHFERLLKSAMNLRDRLIIELPTLQAFRTGEISSLTVEDIDFENGDITVLDSKKLKRILEPLNAILGKHLDEYIRQEGIEKGIVIKPLHGAPHVGRKLGSKTPGLGLSTAHLKAIWKKCCRAADIPEMAPREGRAFFAAKWHFTDHKSVYGLMVMMRHTSLRVTQRYLEHHIDYHAVKSEFNQGQPFPFVEALCANKDSCLGFAPGCRCRLFQLCEVKESA